MSINTDQINIRNAQIVSFISFLFSLLVKRQVWCILDGKRRDEVKSRSVGWIRTKRSLRSRRCLLTFFACFLPQTQLASLRTCIHSSSWEALRDIDEQTKARFEVGRLQPRCIQSRPSGREKCLPAILLVYEFISLTAAHSRTWHKMQKLQYDGVKVQTES